MSTHHIHGEEVHFGHGTENARVFMNKDHNKHEVERHLRDAKEGKQAVFYVEGDRFEKESMNYSAR